MNVLELQIMENINDLPPENLKEILNFIKFIKQNSIKNSEREDELYFMLA